MSSRLVDAVGTVGAFLTTICWVPQAIRIVRTQNTKAISLTSSITFSLGVALWLIYGLALGDLPLIASNLATLVLMTVIVALKVRHG